MAFAFLLTSLPLSYAHVASEHLKVLVFSFKTYRAPYQNLLGVSLLTYPILTRRSAAF